MSTTTIFIVAAIGAVFAFGRDILKAILDSRRGVRERQRKGLEEQRAEVMQPLEIHGLVMKETKEAIAVTSSLLLQGRADLAAETKRRIEAEAEASSLRERLGKAEDRERELLIQLGRTLAHGQGGGV